MADPLKELRETPVEELRQRLRMGIESKKIRQVLREFIPRYLRYKASAREMWAFANPDYRDDIDPDDEEPVLWGASPSELIQFSDHLHKLPPSVIQEYIRTAEENENPDLADYFRRVLDSQETDDEENDSAVGGRRKHRRFLSLAPTRKRRLKKTARKTRKQKRRN